MWSFNLKDGRTLFLTPKGETYLERYHKGARTRNVEARLRYRIRWYEKYVKDWEERGTSSSMMSYFRSSLARAKKELAEYLEEQKDQV